MSYIVPPVRPSDMGTIPTMDEYTATLRHADYVGNVWPPPFRRIEGIVAVNANFVAFGNNKNRDCYLFPFGYEKTSELPSWSKDVLSRIRGSYLMAGLQVLQQLFVSYTQNGADNTVYCTNCEEGSRRTGVYFRDCHNELPLSRMEYYIEALHTRAEINFGISIRRNEDPTDFGREFIC